MANSQPKYHHLIPQTYMSAWEHGNGTLYVKLLDDDKVIERNKERISGINHYHSIFAGMPICTKEDADILFSPVSKYNIKYKDKIVSDSLELNQIFHDFDKWEITRDDGTLVSKRKVKNEIKRLKVNDIEVMWSKQFENRWNDTRNIIENVILTAKTDSVPSFKKEFLMRFYTALNWRSIKSNFIFDDAIKKLCDEIMLLNEIDIPVDERYIDILDNATDEIRHCMLLKFYRLYLNNDGMIYKNAMANLKYTSFHFFIADEEGTFITSDNPSFIYKRKDGRMMGLLPITRRILMCQGKEEEDDGNYYITKLTNKEVIRYNRIIEDNANQFIIIRDVFNA